LNRLFISKLKSQCFHAVCHYVCLGFGIDAFSAFLNPLNGARYIRGMLEKLYFEVETALWNEWRISSSSLVVIYMEAKSYSWYRFQYEDENYQIAMLTKLWIQDERLVPWKKSAWSISEAFSWLCHVRFKGFMSYINRQGSWLPQTQ